jgi:hypothetical protein
VVVVGGVDQRPLELGGITGGVLVPLVSTTFTVSVFCWKVTDSICSGWFSSVVRNSPKSGASRGSGGLISRCAKKASTITIRIGNAALLKNRLIG